MTRLEQDPCNTCEYEEGSTYCKEHCPHEAKVERELTEFEEIDFMQEHKKIPVTLDLTSCGDAIDRRLVCAFIDGLISDDVEREKGLEYIRNMPPVNPQPCEDAISRQAVIDSLHSKFADGFDSDRWWNSMSVLYAINKVPPVNPTKTGHWIKLGVQGEIDDQIVKGFVCSKCGAISVFRMTGRKIINGDLCPGCGAKMLEGVRT